MWPFGKPRVRRFPVRFFIDSETGAVYEGIVVVVAPRGTSASVWVECSCDQFEDEEWCRHSESITDDFDGYGNFYIALDEDLPGSDKAVERISKAFYTEDDASDLRDIVLHYGIVEVI